MSEEIMTLSEAVAVDNLSQPLESSAVAKPPKQPITVRGQIQDWNLGNTPADANPYIVSNFNYGKFRQIAKPRFFSAADGSGEQRMSKKARVNALKKFIENHKYTPTTFYAGVDENTEVIREKGSAVITLREGQFLPLTDGNHRNTVLETLRQQGGATQRKVDNLPITCIIHLRPDRTKENFINLQDTCAVDSGQLLTMKVINKTLKPQQQDNMSFALETAKLLHTASNSHLYRLVKFDTQSGGSIKFKSLAAAGKSDWSTSLYGSALIAREYKKDSEWSANMILFAWEILLNDAPELVRKGMVLCPEPDGTIGGSTLIVGLGNLLGYRMKLLSKEIPSEYDTKMFVNAAKEVFADEETDGNLSSSRKRDLMGAFNEALFRDLVEAEDSVIGTHRGIPIAICLLLGTNTFGVDEMEKPKKPRGRKPGSVSVSKAGKDALKTERSEVKQGESNSGGAAQVVTTANPVVEVDDEIEEDRDETDTDPDWIEDDGPTEENPFSEESVF